MISQTNAIKAVTVFAGRRDSYQIPWALNENDLLECHVADFYSPEWLSDVQLKIAKKITNLRKCSGIPSDKVSWKSETAFMSCASGFITSKRVLLSQVRDSKLSLESAKLAMDTDSVYFPYSYYAGEGIKRYGKTLRKTIVFQVHPHPEYLREVYSNEIERYPVGRASLMKEEDFRPRNRYVELLEDSPRAADAIICASTFTKKSLIAAGVKRPISIVPYGVDITKFRPRISVPASDILRIAFVGQITQRKGILHLIEALRTSEVKSELVLVSRSEIPAEFSTYLSQIKFSHFRGLNDQQTWDVVKGCHFLALPSIAEGFGLVILEAMANGVPVIASDATGAPDLITHGKEGYIVASGDLQAIRTVIQKASESISSNEQMGIEARRKSEEYSWKHFRAKLALEYMRLAK